MRSGPPGSCIFLRLNAKRASIENTHLIRYLIMVNKYKNFWYIAITCFTITYWISCFKVLKLYIYIYLYLNLQTSFERLIHARIIMFRYLLINFLKYWSDTSLVYHTDVRLISNSRTVIGLIAVVFSVWITGLSIPVNPVIKWKMFIKSSRRGAYYKWAK